MTGRMADVTAALGGGWPSVATTSPEQWPEEVRAEDVRLMRDAG